LILMMIIKSCWNINKIILPVKMDKLKSVFIGIIIFVLFTAIPVKARWFVLPGIFYTDEYSLAVIMETQRKERIETRLEYFGSDEGQVLFNIFVPRQKIEWSYEGRYQISEREAFSSSDASNHDWLIADIRYWTETWARCDFLLDKGLFWGLQGSYKRFRFKNDPEFSGGIENESFIASIFTEGEEYTASLRVGTEKRDNRYHSSSGTYAFWQLDLSYSSSEGNRQDLVRSLIDLRKYLPIAKSKKSLLAFNFRGGVIHHTVPYFSQFSMGGSRSLRGFPLNRYHGNAYYLFRVELRQILKTGLPSPVKLLKKDDPRYQDHTFSTGFVVFSDCGDMWRHREGWWGFRQNVGVGLRAIFPPDVVASIDIATPVDADYIAVYLDLRQSF